MNNKYTLGRCFRNESCIMNRITFLFLFLIGISSNFVNAQTTRDVEAEPSSPVYQASKQKKKFSFANLFKKKDDSRKLPYEQQADFEKRMKAVAKQKTKEARLMGKPENSNKLYFGHKRKPKKRKNGKKKYCKICEFSH